MANRRVLTWPNSKLTRVSTDVEKFDEDLHDLANDLIDTLNVSMGAGLAAPQIGVNKRVVVIQCKTFGHENPEPHDRNADALILVNPVLETSGEMIQWTEACLSIPGYEAKVARHAQAIVKYQTLDGEKRTLNADWPLSGGLQHECDHLDGRLFTSKLSFYERTSIEKKIVKRQRAQVLASREYNRKMRLERKGIYDEEAYKRMTHGTGKRKKKPKKKQGKSYGKNKR